MHRIKLAIPPYASWVLVSGCRNRTGFKYNCSHMVFFFSRFLDLYYILITHCSIFTLFQGYSYIVELPNCAILIYNFEGKTLYIFEWNNLNN